MADDEVPGRLDEVQGRVVGSLVEKELATPQQYPLTANALLLACNQTSNREPVMLLSEAEVQRALDGLKERRLVRYVFPSHGRSATRYRHVLDEALGLDERQRALLGVLLLRGPQTVGELRTRTERLAAFDRLDDVEAELRALAARAEPLVERLARRPGQKEERFRQLLAAGAADGVAAGAAAAWADGERVAAPTAGTTTAGTTTAAGLGAVPAGAVPPAALRQPAEADGAATVEGLRAELHDLRHEVEALRAELQALRHSLGD